jgi:IS5 family transposase
MKRFTVVDSTLIAAHSSSKNKEMKRDLKMSQTKKSNQWNFGMKAQIGVEAENDLIYTAESTTVNLSNIPKKMACLQGDETIALCNRGNYKTNRTLEHFQKEGEFPMLTPSKKPKDAELTDNQMAFKLMLTSVRAIVEHPFRVVKHQFGFVKVHYRGLAKNIGKIVMLFALVNLWLSRKRLLPLLDEMRP